MWKSVFGWSGTTENPRDRQPRVPRLWERLEPRLLLSVVFENVQPTDPATPEDYAIYLEQQAQEEWVPYVPTPEQTKLFITQDGANTKANVSMLFPSSGYVVRDWGQVQQDGNTLYVDAELERWTGIALCVMTTKACEYDLGTLADGDYIFEFRASGRLIESREFRPGPDQYVQYDPTPEQTAVFIVPDGPQMKAKVSMVFPTDGYVVRWGEVQRQGDNLADNYSRTWAFEGIAFYAYAGSFGGESPLGMDPIYRFWSPSLRTHFFTASEAERNKLLSLPVRVWDREGLAWSCCRA